MIVIGDVHGSYDELIKLIEKLPHKDICFVGDLIDRGPKSKQVVDLVIKEKYKCALGNHEDFMIHSIYREEASCKYKNAVYRMWLQNGGQNTIDSYAGDFDEILNHIDWMKTLPLYVKYNNHAGDEFVISHSYANKYWKDRDSNEESFRQSILWDRDSGNTNNMGDLINIIGHTPVEEPYWFKAGQNGPCNLTMIDTGCVFDGSLTAIDLDTMKVYQE